MVKSESASHLHVQIDRMLLEERNVGKERGLGSLCVDRSQILPVQLPKGNSKEHCKMDWIMHQVCMELMHLVFAEP